MDEAVAVVLSSLRRRVAAMHQLWQRAVSDLTLAHVNHVERPGVLPIAFSLVHCIGGEDRTISTQVLAEPTLWDQGQWAARVGLPPAGAPRGIAMPEAEALRVGDLDAWRAYQTAVFARTETALAALDATRLEAVLYGGAIPPVLQGAFVTLIAAPGGPIRLVDALEGLVYQHGLRHLGEVEHARALVGLRGLT